MERPPHDRDLVLSESEVRAVIERAVLIEARSGALSVKELERVAAEAGISSVALSAALRELLEQRNAPVPALRPAATPETVAAPTTPQRRSFLRSALRVAVVAGTGWVAGMLAGAGDGEALFGCGVLIAGAILRAFHHRRTDTPGDFQVELLTAWTSFVVGFGMGQGDVPPDLVLAVGVMYVWSAGVGGVISAGRRFRWPWQGRRPDDDATSTRG